MELEGCPIRVLDLQGDDAGPAIGEELEEADESRLHPPASIRLQIGASGGPVSAEGTLEAEAPFRSSARMASSQARLGPQLVLRQPSISVTLQPTN